MARPVITQSLVGAVEIDCTVSVSWTGPNEATEDPIERGAPVTDHVIAGLKRCTISAIFSNTPLSVEDVRRMLAVVGTVTDEARPVTIDGYARTQLDKLRAYKKDKTVVRVVTHDDVVEEMFVLDAAPSRDADTGDAVAVTITLQEARFAENKATKIKLYGDPKAKRKKAAVQTVLEGGGLRDATGAETKAHEDAAAAYMERRRKATREAEENFWQGEENKDREAKRAAAQALNKRGPVNT